MIWILVATHLAAAIAGFAVAALCAAAKACNNSESSF